MAGQHAHTGPAACLSAGEAEVAMGDAQWRVTVNRDACVSSGVCEGIAPMYFELREGRSRAKAAEIEADEIVLVATESCPVLAISVWARESGDLIAPQR